MLSQTAKSNQGLSTKLNLPCLRVFEIGVFTGLIKGIGVSGIQVEEIYSIDKETLEDLKYGWHLCFVYPRKKAHRP